MGDYYIEPAGNDGNLGTAPGAGNAWLTVEHAEEAGGLAAGDTKAICGFKDDCKWINMNRVIPMHSQEVNYVSN